MPAHNIGHAVEDVLSNTTMAKVNVLLEMIDIRNLRNVRFIS